MIRGLRPNGVPGATAAFLVFICTYSILYRRAAVHGVYPQRGYVFCNGLSARPKYQYLVSHILFQPSPSKGGCIATILFADSVQPIQHPPQRAALLVSAAERRPLTANNNRECLLTN